MAINFDYSRVGRQVSSRRGGIPALSVGLLCSALLAAALPAAAQYVGKIDVNKQKEPELRAVAVLEWTGKIGDPKTSRLIPLTIWDGQTLQDASIYMARPAPMALDSEVEYKLKKDGKTIGLYDVSSAAQQQGSWVGYGSWKPLPVAKPAPPPKKIADSGFGDDSGPPILHRKSDSEKSASKPAPPPDPDRPILREPTKEKKPAEENHQETVAYSQPLAHISDPDRPRLTRGKPESSIGPVLPTLIGLPKDMNQTIAVSDARNRPDHIWKYSWPNPTEEATMKSDLEEIARKELGLVPPPAPPAPAHKRTSRREHAKAAPPPPAAPAPLQDENFRVFELEYGSGPTMVFSARAKGKGPDEKFITLIAQPDLYGNVKVLLKHQTDSLHLDLTPEMHLIDAVDAMADNRGELLFEMRGASQREFALYRVLQGQVQKLFTSAPESVVMPPAANPAG